MLLGRILYHDGKRARQQSEAQRTMRQTGEESSVKRAREIGLLTTRPALSKWSKWKAVATPQTTKHCPPHSWH
jgi:hypothetical protein